MQSDQTYDIIIVGSGPSGAMGAETLRNSGKKVLMLDGGNSDDYYHKLVPNQNFEEARKTDYEQHKYLLGNFFEVLPKKGISVGAQLSPSRRSIIKDVTRFLPLKSSEFKPMESLGLGGLGAGWGLGAYVYNVQECHKAGLSEEQMKSSYQFVADHIGISGPSDSFKNEVLLELQNIQKPLQVDNSIDYILKKYTANKTKLNAKGIKMGIASMALLSEDLGCRKACQYDDFDFYTDQHQSAYRPQFTVNQLVKDKQIEYLGNQLVLSFAENDNGIIVESLNMLDETKHQFKAKKLLLGSGALGTARMVMRSLPEIKQLPLLSNPYLYIPTLNLKMLGKKLNSKKSSMAQAMMLIDLNGKQDQLVSIAFYTYQSLMLFRLVNESPLNYADNRILFQFLQSAFVIAGVHFADEATAQKKLHLQPNENSPTGDHLVAEYQLNEIENLQIDEYKKEVKKVLRKLGLIPIKSINPGAGSSIHYAGTLPFSKTEKLGFQSHEGRIYGTQNVFVLDSSGFNFLPAKGVTLSIMANAHRVVTHILSSKTPL